MHSVRRGLDCRPGRMRPCSVEGERHERNLWIIVVGFVAGMVARWLSPGPNTPSGFILTTVLGIAGAFLATFLGQTLGWYRADQGAGFIAATLGAVPVLFIWNRLVANGVIGDSGNRQGLVHISRSRRELLSRTNRCRLWRHTRRVTLVASHSSRSFWRLSWD